MTVESVGTELFSEPDFVGRIKEKILRDLQRKDPYASQNCPGFQILYDLH